MTYDPEFTTNRDALFSVLPPWLRNFWGARLLYAITIQVDALEEMVKQAVLARFPGFNASALPDLCRARAIIRGPHETEAQITRRLIEWLEIHRLDGHPGGILQQLLANFSPWSLHMRVVFANGNYFDSDAAITRAQPCGGRTLGRANHAIPLGDHLMRIKIKYVPVYVLSDAEGTLAVLRTPSHARSLQADFPGSTFERQHYVEPSWESAIPDGPKMISNVSDRVRTFLQTRLEGQA